MQMQPYDTIVQNFINRNNITPERYYLRNETRGVPDLPPSWEHDFTLVQGLVQQMAPEEIFGIIWQTGLYQDWLGGELMNTSSAQEGMRAVVAELLIMELDKRIPEPTGAS